MSAVRGRSVQRRWLAGMVLPLALVGGLFAAVPAAQAAAYGSSYAYVHADKPSEFAYVPAGSRNVNTSGGTNDVNRLGTGWYRVRFPDVATKPDASLGVAHVTAYGDSAAYCSVSDLGRYGFTHPLTGVEYIFGVTAQIRCFDAVGAPVDSEFTASWTNAYGIGGHSDFAYLTTRLPDQTHDLSSDPQFNSTGQVNKMERVGTGRYTVWLPGFGSKGLDDKADRGHLQVTAHSDQGHRCKVLAYLMNHDDTQVELTCYDAAGERADSRFSLTYARDASIVWSPWGAYTRVSGTATFPQWTYPDDHATVTQGVGSGEGIFWVQTSLDGFMEHGNIQVTAEGSGAHHCKVAGWSPDRGIEVRCFNYKGDPVRNPFLVSFAL